MRSLIFLIFAGCAVRCDDASYYVIEIPEESREYSKPFRVFWNVPTMQCRSKRIPFENLFEKYGIIQNKDDSFRGEKIAILYDPGLFPALLKNETSGKFIFRNGGVPQEGDLQKHLEAFRITMEQSIPDPDFSGVGIIDFESWRPIFRQNFGVLIPYKDISYQIERKLHWFWTERAIQAKARQRFEEAAREFMQTTLSVAKQMRPRALWGYYGFPYCFNMASNNMVESCADKVGQENDRSSWLWRESTAVYPSVYSPASLGPRLAALVRGRVREAARVSRAPLIPYVWYRYRDGGFFTQKDLFILLETLYKSEASGFIIWGSSSDVNTVEKCKSLLKYTEEVLGPAIAKYTKTYNRKNVTDDLETTSNPVSNQIGLTTWRPVLKDQPNNPNSTIKPEFLDPEYHWEPPENYTHDIVHYVEQEFKRKPTYDNKKPENQTPETNVRKNVLLDIIINIFKDEENKETTENTNQSSLGNLIQNNINSEIHSTKTPKFSIDSTTTGSVTVPDYKKTVQFSNDEMFELTTELSVAPSSTADLNSFVSFTPSETREIFIYPINNSENNETSYTIEKQWTTIEPSPDINNTDDGEYEYTTESNFLVKDPSQAFTEFEVSSFNDDGNDTIPIIGADLGEIYGVTNSSHESTNVPLLDIIRDRLNSDEYNFNETTIIYLDNETTTDRAYMTLDSTLDSKKKNKYIYSKNDQKGHHFNKNNDSNSDGSSGSNIHRYLGVTGDLTTLGETNVFEHNLNTKSPSSDIKNTSHTNNLKKDESSEVGSANEPTEDDNSSSISDYSSTTEYIEYSDKYRTNIETEDYSIATNTMDGAPTTDTVQQVVIYL